MNAKDFAIVIIALGTAGIPIVLIMFTVGGLLAGFAIYSLFSFLSQWMVPLIFFGAGLVAFIELVTRGPKMALVGLGALGTFVFVGYFLWSGAFKGPTNTYSLFLSAVPSSGAVASMSGSMAGSLAFLVAAIMIGSALLLWIGPKLVEWN